MNFIIKILIGLFLFITAVSTAQVSQKIILETKSRKLPYGLIQKIPINQPDVGLALSGGGARGLAQIGVLRALEEAEIQISLIAGTSIGSIVGGCYASGYSVDDLDSMAVHTDWNRLLSLTNTSERRELFVDQKIAEDRSLITLRLDGLTPIIPTAFNEGLRLSNYLTLLCLNAPIATQDNFDNLMVKYRAVCTNLVNGDLVVLSAGSLARAMRASSSVSFLLAPVVIDTLTLVDGGLVSNIPVHTVKSMGADYIIAVNTTSNLRSEEELELPWNVADQTVSIPMKRLEEEELLEADFILTPEINKWTSTSYSQVDSLILEGYRYAKNFIPEIKSKIDSLLIKNSGLKETWYGHIKHKKNVMDFEKKYYEKYFTSDSVSNFELYSDLCELYKSGRFDSLGVLINMIEDSVDITFFYSLNPTIQNVEIISDGTVSDEEKVSISKTLIGKPFDGIKIFGVIRDAIKRFKKQGYLLFDLINFSFDGQTRELTLEFSTGTISSININSQTSKAVIEREFDIKVGDKLIYSSLEEGLKNLRATELFDDINLSIEQEGKYANIYLSVNERIPRLVNLGFLINNVYNFQFGVDFRNVNFLESGNELGLFLFGGTTNGAYILDYTAYRILNTYYTYKISAYYKFNDIGVYSNTVSSSGNTFTSNEIGEYKQIFYGASLALGTQLEKFGKLIFTGKYQVDEIRNIVGNTVNPYTTDIVSLKIGAVVDNQNKYPYPDDGLLFNGFYETAQGILGGDESYILLNADFKYYIGIGSDNVIAPRIQAGFGDKTLPLSEQFSLGGQYSFFGAYENEYRGRQIFLASLMYQYKLPFKIFFDTYTWFRYDVGSTWQEQETIKFKDLRHGIGGSISFDTPVGPADFSVGRSFLINQGLQSDSFVWGDVLFYFSIGYIINY
ncbi:MAG: patatin-like phospholipase family protein [Ignavibacteriales bacterium]